MLGGLQGQPSICTYSISPSKETFSVGEAWTVSLNSCPANSVVKICALWPSPSVLPGQSLSCTEMGGTTDNNGKWSLSGVFTIKEVGSSIQYAEVGTQRSTQITFKVK